MSLSNTWKKLHYKLAVWDVDPFVPSAVYSQLAKEGWKHDVSLMGVSAIPPATTLKTIWSPEGKLVNHNPKLRKRYEEARMRAVNKAFNMS